MAASSRLIIKNIPKHMSEDRLREHFENFTGSGNVTDVKILRRDGKSRQFAFVGFHSTKEARQAKAHFDQTYVDTSKVSIEFARPVGDGSIPRPWSKYSAGSSRNDMLSGKVGPGGRGRVAGGDDDGKYSGRRFDGVGENGRGGKGKKMTPEEEKKLEEFLAVTKKRKKENIWGNDEGGIEPEKKKAKLANAKVVKKEKTKEGVLIEQAVESRRRGGEGVFMKKVHVMFDNSDEEGEEEEQGQDSGEVEDDNEGEEDGGKKKRKRNRKRKNAQNSDEEMVEEDKKEVFDETVDDMDYIRSRMTMQPSSSDAESEEEEKNGEDEEDEKTSKKSNRDVEDGEEEEEKSGDEEGDTKKGAQQEEEDDVDAAETGRIFIKNVPYDCTIDDLHTLCKRYGDIADIDVPLDPITKKPRGIAFVLFMDAVNAVQAMTALDGSIFQGRLLYVSPAKLKPKKVAVGDDVGRLSSYQQEKLLEKQEKSTKEEFSWNALFLRSDAVADAAAGKYGMQKGELLDATSGDSLPVRMALAETQIIAETKRMFEEEGVNLDVLASHSNKRISRSHSVLIVKNLPSFTNKKELEMLFSPLGALGRIVLAPSNSICIVEFLQEADAKKAFRSLAYKKFHHVPLFLEWAPRGIFVADVDEERKKRELERATKQADSIAANSKAVAKSKIDIEGEERRDADADSGADSDLEVEEVLEDISSGATLYVKNLNFSTTEDALQKYFGGKKAVRAVTIAKKRVRGSADSQPQSQGYGFVEFKTKEFAVKALRTKQGKELDGHELKLKFARGQSDLSQPSKSKERKSEDIEVKPTTKLMVKNIAFEATKKELRDLFSPFGNIKSVRLPKKFSGGHRGFGFVEFLSKEEAKGAREALKHSHFYGRHLVIDYAAADLSVEELQAQTKKEYDALQRQ